MTMIIPLKKILIAVDAESDSDTIIENTEEELDTRKNPNNGTIPSNNPKW